MRKVLGARTSRLKSPPTLVHGLQIRSQMRFIEVRSMSLLSLTRKSGFLPLSHSQGASVSWSTSLGVDFAPYIFENRMGPRSRNDTSKAYASLKLTWLFNVLFIRITLAADLNTSFPYCFHQETGVDLCYQADCLDLIDDLRLYNPKRYDPITFTRTNWEGENYHKVPWDIAHESCRITVDLERPHFLVESSSLQRLGSIARGVFHTCPWEPAEDDKHTMLGRGGSVLGGDGGRLLIKLWMNPDMAGERRPLRVEEGRQANLTVL